MNFDINKLINFLNTNNFKKEASFLNKISKRNFLRMIDKSEMLNLAMNTDYKISFDIPALKMNQGIIKVANIIQQQVEEEYPKVVKEYIEFITEDNNQLGLAMNQFLMPNSYSLDGDIIPGKKFDDPEEMIKFVIGNYVGYMFHIIFDSSEIPYCKGSAACNNMSGVINVFVDRIFPLGKKLARWAEEGVLIVLPNERVDVKRVGTNQVYLGEGRVDQNIVELDDGSYADLSKMRREDAKKIEENIKDEKVYRTFVQEYDQLGVYDFIIKIYDQQFPISEDKIHNSGDYFIINEEDLPKNILDYLNKKVEEAIIGNEDSLTSALNPIIEHEMIHTKQIEQVFETPDKKSEKVEYNKDLQYEKGSYRSYGWAAKIYEILEKEKISSITSNQGRGTPEEEAEKRDKVEGAKSKVKQGIGQWLNAHHRNMFGVELKNIFKEMFGTVTVTKQRFNILFKNYTKGGDVNYNGKTYTPDDTLAWYLNTFKVLEEISNEYSDDRYSSPYYMYDPIRGENRLYTFKELLNLAINHAEKQVKLDSGTKEDIFNSLKTKKAFYRLKEIRDIFLKSARSYDDKYDFNRRYVRNNPYQDFELRTPAGLENDPVINPQYISYHRGSYLKEKPIHQGNYIVLPDGKEIGQEEILLYLKTEYNLTIYDNFTVSLDGGHIFTNKDSRVGRYLRFQCDEFEKAYKSCQSFDMALDDFKGYAIIEGFMKNLIHKKILDKFAEKYGKKGLVRVYFYRGSITIAYNEENFSLSKEEEKEIRTDIRKLVNSLNEYVSFGSFYSFNVEKQEPRNPYYGNDP